MKLSIHDFYNLTPRQFDRRLSMYMDTQREMDYRFGVIAANIVNVAPTKKRKSWRPSDFFPSLRQSGYVSNDHGSTSFELFEQSIQAANRIQRDA